jgi:hypothetical protein
MSVSNLAMTLQRNNGGDILPLAIRVRQCSWRATIFVRGSGEVAEAYPQLTLTSL